MTQFEKLLAVIEEVKEEENKINRNHENVQESSCVRDALEKNRASKEQLSEEHVHLLEENKAHVHLLEENKATPLHWAVSLKKQQISSIPTIYISS